MEKEIQELTSLVKEVQGQVEGYKSELASLKEKGVDKDGLKEFTDKIEASEKAQDALKEELAEFAANLEKNSKQESQNKSLGSQIEAGLLKSAELMKGLQEKGGNGFTPVVGLSLKAAGTMSTSNYSGGTVGLTQMEGGLALVARRSPYLRQIMNFGFTNKRYVAWAEQTARDGGAGSTAEGAAKTQADFDVVETNKIVEKITVYHKASKEMLDDIDYMGAEINNDGMSLLELKLDSLLYNGDGVTPNIKGIVTYATAFSVAASALADTITAANRFDAIRAAVWQCQAANFQPNYVLLNPIDVAVMDLTKLTDGQYVLPPFSSINGMTIAGLKVVINNGVTAGDFLVGDFTKANLRMREDVMFAVGYENDDFTKNLVTILGEMRAVHYVKAVHTTAFVKGTFTTAIAALQV